MVTPRRTRLLRTANLQLFQAAIADLTRTGDPWIAHDTAVLVPTRAAAEQLRRTLEELTLVGEHAAAVIALPEVLTRDEWYRAMADRAFPFASLLSDVERYVCMLAAARAAVASGVEPPFNLRPGLVPAIVGFYDDLMRNQRTVDSFERLTVSDLEPSVELDRGARRLLKQTHFLVAAFRSFQRQLAEIGRLDEHGLRRLLVDGGQGAPFARIIVTVADRPAEPDGLWPADFDLLARLPGLERVDLVATDAVLDSGFHDRLVELLPGIEEDRWSNASDKRPVLVTPSDSDQHHHVWRDREEELLGVLQTVKTQGHPVDGAEAVVFQRPLPYLYLARQLFAEAGVPFDARDALPLAAEPYAAALDLVAEFVASDYGRSQTVELLRSPHFSFSFEGRALADDTVDALDSALDHVRYSGGREGLAALAASWTARDAEGSRVDRLCACAVPAAVVATTLAADLQMLEKPAPPSASLELLARFLSRHRYRGPRVSNEADMEDRTSRVRTTILAGLAALRRAHRTIDDTPVDLAELMMLVRRWIETQTFTPAAGSGGVQLVDARAARYGRFRDLFIVGLVDDDWPDRPTRSIFFPASLLGPLGWSKERDRRRAAQAQFSDLVRLARERVSLSTFSLDNDAVVTPSVFLERLAETELLVVREPQGRRIWVTPSEALARTTVVPGDLSTPGSSWLVLRLQRPPRDARFRGTAGSSRVSVHSVSALERYLDCPFKYFARHELHLDEASDDNLTLTARRRGLILHQLLETFFSTWQRDGEGAITLANIDRAIDRFRGLVEEVVRGEPSTDRPVIRAWLLGSAAAPGLVEQLCLLEIERPVEVVERLVEVGFDGTFVLRARDRQRTARIRGVADRIDLLADGTFRVIDYKTSRAPHRDRALQLPLYARCAEQQLDGYRQRSWRVSDAAYVAFGEARVHVPLTRHRLDDALAQGEARAVDVLEQIGRGIFPPRPAQLYRCGSCPYPTVCRKDYVDQDERTD